MSLSEERIQELTQDVDDMLLRMQLTYKDDLLAAATVLTTVLGKLIAEKMNFHATYAVSFAVASHGLVMNTVIDTVGRHIDKAVDKKPL